MIYSGLKDPSRWVLPAVLAEQAQRQPDATWVETVDGERCTFAEAWRDAREVAGWFAQLGVKPGDHVAIMMASHLDFVRAWTGLGLLGATVVLLNTELHGAFLAHQLRNCGARIVVVDPSFVAAVEEASADLVSLDCLVVTRKADAPAGRLPQIAWDDRRGAPAYDGPLPAAQQIACVMYTSGTSGPAKGVLMPHAHCTLYGIGSIKALQLRPDDRYYITLPLFHANGLLMQLGATLLAGIPAIVRSRFSASAWLGDVRKHEATVTNLLGSTAAFVLAQPAGENDARHRLRAVCSAPNLPLHEASFRERFDVADVISGFGMTEVNIPVWGRLGQSCPGASGWTHEEWFDVIVADPETDREVSRGDIGEILVRPKVPFGFMAGYLDMPDRTVEAWRNLWFHTGDAGTMDASGLLTFVDRIKDCIRRRGENISATEVEMLVGRIEGVAEVAAYAVPSAVPGCEDELMLAVVMAPDTGLRVEDLIAQADVLLPRFAKPGFVRMLDALPKTATGKLQRAVLRKEGVTGAWARG
ncbi:MAG: AMP-binding protein [Pseudomonadota bacterium]